MVETEYDEEKDDYDDEKEESEEDAEEDGDEEEDDDEEDEEDELTAMKFDVRDDWLLQQRYVKYMEQANFLWDQFTSGNI